MQEEFMHLSSFSWNIIFWVTRYVLVALLLAYLGNVLVKRKDIQTDIKGRVVEWRVESFKSLHHWLMKFKSVIAPPNQDEERYRNILSISKFKIGYQGMEYASFFDTPERLLQFDMEYDQLLAKEEAFFDERLRNKLHDFQDWLGDVIVFYNAFIHAENDPKWKFGGKTVEKHCLLACKLLGIGLQEDVNTYFKQLDEMLHNRLGEIKISGVYDESKSLLEHRKAKDYYQKSQLYKNQYGLMAIFVLVHFEEQFAKNPSLMKDSQRFLSLSKEYMDCYSQYLKQCA